MNVESEIKDLKAKLQAIEAVHASIIAAMAQTFATIAGVTADQLMRGVRESISTSANGGDPALAERMKLLSEQYVDDAVHMVQHCMKSLDRPA